MYYWCTERLFVLFKSTSSTNYFLIVIIVFTIQRAWKFLDGFTSPQLDLLDASKYLQER